MVYTRRLVSQCTVTNTLPEEDEIVSPYILSNKIPLNLPPSSFSDGRDGTGAEWGLVDPSANNSGYIV